MPLPLILVAPSCLTFGAFIAKFPKSVGPQHPSKIPKQNPMVSRRARSVRDSRMRTVTCHINGEKHTVERPTTLPLT